MSLLKPLMQSETQTEDSWEVSLVQDQLLILKHLHDEMQGRINVNQAFSSTLLLQGTSKEDAS